MIENVAKISSYINDHQCMENVPFTIELQSFICPVVQNVLDMHSVH